jgi:dienelactone hydrolase
MTVRTCLYASAMLIATAVSTRADMVSIPASTVTLTADLAVPNGTGPFPAVIALHGCNGMRARDGQSLNARHRDWNGRLLTAGFAVLTLDSFSARGQSEICTMKEHAITPQIRADDVRAALTWLAARPEIDAKRIALLGWSHGGMTVLWAVRPGFLAESAKPAAAIAFYPGCREVAKLEGWEPVVSLTMLTGALDDWTPAAPCRELARRTGARYIEYAESYHGFDAPDAPVRLRTGLGRVKGGEAHFGTNSESRAASIVEVMTTLQRVAATAGK